MVFSAVLITYAAIAMSMASIRKFLNDRASATSIASITATQTIRNVRETVQILLMTYDMVRGNKNIVLGVIKRFLGLFSDTCTTRIFS